MIYPARRTIAFRASPAMGVAGVYALFYRGAPWQGEWYWTVDWACGAVILVGPLLAGSVALEVAQTRPRDSAPAGTSLSARVRSWTAPMLSSFAVAATVFGGVVTVALVLTAITGPAGLPRPWLIAVALLSLLAASAIGVGIGAAIRNVVAAPLAALIVFGLSAAAASGAVPPLFRIGGTTGTLVGLRWSWASLGWTSLALVSVVVAIIAVLVALWPPRRPRAVGALTIAVGAVILAGVASAAMPSHGQRLVSRDVALSCAGDRPQVCLTTDADRQLLWLADTMTRLTAHLAAREVDVATRFVQDVPGRVVDPTSAVMFIESADINRAEGTVARAADYLTTPAACPAYTADVPPPEASFVARDALRAWLLVADGAAEPGRWKGASWHAWLTGPQADQDAWLTRTYRQLRACRLDALTPP